MEKKIWTKPCATVEQFAMNEYIAACGDSGVVYKFKCNAGDENSRYNVYLADGTAYCTSGRDNGGLKKDFDSYSPCGDTHEAESDSVFLKGYMYKQSFLSGGNTGDRIDVIIWTENYTNCHCTAQLDMDAWETAKS